MWLIYIIIGIVIGVSVILFKFYLEDKKYMHFMIYYTFQNKVIQLTQMVKRNTPNGNFFMSLSQEDNIDIRIRKVEIISERESYEFNNVRPKMNARTSGDNSPIIQKYNE